MHGRDHACERRCAPLHRRRQGQLLRPLFAHYEIDGEEEPDVPHVLELSEYQTTDDAVYDSWLLLEVVGVPAEAATEAAEPEVAEPEVAQPEPMEVATA